MITIYIQHCNFYAFSTLLYIIFWIYCNTEEQGSTVSYILCMNKYWVSRNTMNVFCGWIAWKQEVNLFYLLDFLGLQGYLFR